MILDLIPEDNQILHQKVKKCSYNLDRKELSKTLIENMIHHEGLGLSANQIGIPERAFAMIRNVEYNEIIVCFNPKIIKKSEKLSKYEEGCLSIPNLFAEVKRPSECEVQYLDYRGEKKILKATGLLATCIQHEIDHLKGILFIDYLSKLKRDIILKKLSKQKIEQKRLVI